jgi:hypothetical protein
VLFRRTRAYHKGSVLPAVRPARVADGYRLDIDRTGRTHRVALWILGPALAGNGFVLYLLATGDRDPVLLLRTGITAALLVAMIVATMKSLRLRRASLVFRRWPLRLGEEVEAAMRAYLKHEATSVSARVDCTEVAQAHAGSKMESTRSETIFAIDLAPAQWDARRHIITATWRFAVPAEMPASFDVIGNKIRWQLAATIVAGDVEVPVAFDLVVIPEVAS